MKQAYIILILLFIFACQNDNSEKENKTVVEDSLEENTVENETEIMVEDTNGIAPFNLYINEKGLIETTDSVSKYLSPEGLKVINLALEKYSKIETDSAMADFYINYLSEAYDTLENVFYKYSLRFEYFDDTSLEEWDESLGLYIPFMIYIFDNTFDGPNGYIHTEALLKKSLKTKGGADEAFFESQIKCTGNYNATFSGLHYRLVDADIYHSTFGGGFHYEALKSVMRADSVSDIFKRELDLTAEYILQEDEITTFGYSKEEVYNEIELLLSLKNSTNYDFTNLENLKLFLDTTSLE